MTNGMMDNRTNMTAKTRNKFDGPDIAAPNMHEAKILFSRKRVKDNAGFRRSDTSVRFLIAGKRMSRSGFTLVELSIVLVIIGLIIGGVLTGRQILQNAEITNALNGIQAFQAQFQTYVQNYGAIPGDDANATTRFPNSSIPSGDSSGTLGNGTLEGNFDSAAANDETRLVWAELRAADLVKLTAGTDPTAQPANPFGGIYGFQHGAFGTGGITSNVVCLSEVPADAAQAIDSRLDDGTSSSGSVQATVTAAGPGAAAAAASTTGYVAGQTYTVCVRM